MSGDELVIFPPSSVAGLAAIRYRVEPVRCPVVGSSDVGYCRCVLAGGHTGPHACQHEIWQ